MIRPTVGRVVWFYEKSNEGPQAAIVAHVHSDRMVNLGVINRNGEMKGRPMVTLLQDEDVRPETGAFCEWMPYQKGQAGKVEELEAAQAAE